MYTSILCISAVISCILGLSQDSNPMPFSCLDCKRVKVCTPQSKCEVIQCPDDRPYCDFSSGSCTPFKSPECEGLPDEFYCMKDGLFPHPTDCHQYYNCSNLQANLLTCPDWWYYFPPDKDCTIVYRYGAPFHCAGLNATKVPSRYDGSVYAYCINGYPYVVSSCEGSYELNVTSQACEPVCYTEENLVDNTDCTQYYICIKMGRKKFVYQKLQSWCWNGQGFDPKTKQCVDLENLPECKAAVDARTPV